MLMMPPAPRPWITRAAISMVKVWESAQPSEPRVKTASPAM
jgi:hypothetical protein